MARNDKVLFYLDEGQRFRLSCNNLQWILERGRPEKRRPGKDSGYRGIASVCSTKAILRCRIREKGAIPSPAAAVLLDALPDTFFECRELVRALGIDGFREWLRSRAAGLMPLWTIVRRGCSTEFPAPGHANIGSMICMQLHWPEVRIP